MKALSKKILQERIDHNEKEFSRYNKEVESAESQIEYSSEQAKRTLFILDELYLIKRKLSQKGSKTT